MAFGSKQLAIDLGTENTRIYIPKKGMVVDEATNLALSKEGNYSSVVAVGNEAATMLGKSPQAISVVSPMRAGVIADYKATSVLLSRFIQQASGRFHLSKPEAMLTISASASSTERKALIDASLEGGLQNVNLIDAATAAALGSGQQITDSNATMIIDIGAGTTELGIFSLGGSVASSAIRVGGVSIDDAIRLMARREHGVLLADTELQLLKRRFLNLKTQENKSKTIDGQSIIHGTPKKVTFKQRQLQSYVERPLEMIAREFKRVLEQAPPDVISDIAKSGVVLSGGSAQLKGLKDYFAKKLQIACVVAENPELCGIKGAHMALTHLADYRKSLLS